jgi:formamidopyrimidine-DNA glycosylase
MPELPDITVYVEALARRVEGATLQSIRVQGPALLRSVDPPLAEASGRRVVGVRRLGKRVVVELEGEIFLILHLMIAGRLHWSDAGAPAPRGRGLARFDFSSGTLVLTEAGTRKRATLHLARGEVALAQHDRGGLEVLEADPQQFRERLAGASHTLKRALTDPRIFSGIGNAYSDEILHRARLSPLKLTGRLTDEEHARLHAAVQSTLTDWTRRLRAEAAGRFPEKVTAFREGMAVHGRYRKPCPVCGDPVQRIVFAENETNYCATCQTGGRLLADRALSRLLKKDWPRTLEELEERKAAKRPRSEPKASEGGPPRELAAKRPRSEPKASQGGPLRELAAKRPRSEPKASQGGPPQSRTSGRGS